MFNIRAKMFNKRAKIGAEQILNSLEIHSGQVIADLGSGGGYYTYAFAEMVGSGGKVYAVDTDTTFLAHIEKTIAKKQIKNIELVTASEKGSNLKENSCDLIFMRNVFHHITAPVNYFKRIKKALKPDGRIAIIDWKPGSTYFAHSTSREQLCTSMNTAGYKIYKSYDFLSNQSFIIFKAK